MTRVKLTSLIARIAESKQRARRLLVLLVCLLSVGLSTRTKQPQSTNAYRLTPTMNRFPLLQVSRCALAGRSTKSPRRSSRSKRANNGFSDQINAAAAAAWTGIDGRPLRQHRQQLEQEEQGLVMSPSCC